MNKIFFIKTFGCEINSENSSQISNILISNNFIKSYNIEDSDILIINTCSIRKGAEKKLYNFLIKINNKYKNKFLIIVGGCVVSAFFFYLLNKINFINILFGPRDLFLIFFLIKAYEYNNCKQISINFFNNYFYKNVIKNYFFSNNFYINIVEGCNKCCSYCIVPYSRGAEISKCLLYILKNLFFLNKKIFYGVYLLGQNVNSYIAEIYQNSKKFIKFNILIKYIFQFFNINYINYITSHPQDFNLNLIILHLNNKLSNSIHLPIQSCSNNILNFMNRGYDLFYYKNIVKNLRKIKNNINISTDIIVGFPNENILDFLKTLLFVEKLLFDKSYIYLYNSRPYTKSYFFLDNISIVLKKIRFLLIEKKIKNNIYYINKLILGKTEYSVIKIICLDSNNIFWSTTINRYIKFIYLGNLFIIGKVVKIKILKKLFENFFGEIF